MSTDPRDTSLWHNDSQRALLKAALTESDDARDAWVAWRRSFPDDRGAAWARGIEPELFANLEATALPENDLQELRDAFFDSWSRSSRLLNDLARAVATLRRAGIESIAFKGAALALSFPDRFGARSMGDSDLFVRPSDLEAALEALEGAGWTSSQGRPPRSVLTCLPAFNLVSPEGRIIDLHHRPFGLDSPIAADLRLFERATTARRGGVDIGVPDSTDLFLLAAFHARRLDPQSSCRWVLDCTRLLDEAEAEIRWNALAERARELEITPVVVDTLNYLRQDLGVSVPGSADLLLRASPITEREAERYPRISNREKNSLRDIFRRYERSWRLYREACDRSRRPLDRPRFYWEIVRWNWGARSSSDVFGKALTRVPRTLFRALHSKVGIDRGR